jgi:hypothetical protein
MVKVFITNYKGLLVEVENEVFIALCEEHDRLENFLKNYTDENKKFKSGLKHEIDRLRELKIMIGHSWNY